MANRAEGSCDRRAAAAVPSGVDLMVLTLLAEEPAYGYRIQKQLSVASRGLVQLQAGTLYPLLHRLEVNQLVSSRWEKSGGRKRKYYALTALGRRRLKSEAQDWTEFAAALQELLRPFLAAPPQAVADTH